MTTFADDIAGAQTSRPRWGVDVIYTAQTIRFATGDLDLMIGGFKYPTQLSRVGEVAECTMITQSQLQIQVHCQNPAIVPYIRQCLPPQQPVYARVWEQQQTSGAYEQVFFGKVTSVKLEGPLATMLIPSELGFLMNQRIPTISVDQLCGNALYDDNCQVDRNSFKVDTTMTTWDNVTVNVASVGGHSNEWAQNGELLHVPSGERATIVHQIGTALTLHLPILGMQDGDAVTVYGGCAHDIITCHVKFDNQENFAGCPDLPTANPFINDGFGSITQT